MKAKFGFQRLRKEDFQNFDEDVASFRKALSGLPDDSVEALNRRSQLGIMLITDQQSFDEGFQLLQAVHEALSETCPTALWARNALRWATALQFAGQHDAALEIFENTTATIRDRGFPLLDFALQHQGKCMVEMSAFDTAEACISEALSIRIEKGDVALIESSERALAGIHERRGQGDLNNP